MGEPARETTRGRAFLDQALAELALAQHGVFGLDQVCELGLSAAAVRNRVAAGRLHRIHHAVYSLVPRELLKREGLYMAAVLACGPGAVLSHRSAARLHELRDYGYYRIDVTVPKRSRRTHPGVAVHTSTTLTEADITSNDNIAVTTVARTLLDLGEVVTQRQLERAFDQAEILETLDLKAINDQLARNPTRRAARMVRTVLSTHYIGQTPTWNDNEEMLLSITSSLGLPDPEVNAFIVLDDGGPAIRVDFVWRDRKLIVEADSQRWHSSRQRIEIDHQRDQRLIAAGWTVIRTTWRQMKFRPNELRTVLVECFRQPPRVGASPPSLIVRKT